MKKRYIIIILNVLFYCTMLCLTVFSEKLYKEKLPKVRIGYLERRLFSEGEEYGYYPALPKDMSSGLVYYVNETRKNKEKCYVVEPASEVVLGSEKDGYYAVLEGLEIYVPIVMITDVELTEGQEVLVENEEDILW